MKRLPRDANPQLVTYAIAATALLAAGLVTAGLILVTAAAIGSSEVLGDLIGWCDPAAAHSGRPWWIAVPVVIALLWIAARLAARIRRYLRRLRPCGPGPILVTQTRTPLAYSVPGRPGQVVVSEAMLRCLNSAERRALLAHERSHLRHGHHRYLLLADLVEIIPPVWPLVRLLRFYLERWADEDAARHVGDRRVVAQAITRAALATTAPLPFATLALSSVGVPERVAALLAEPVGEPDSKRAGRRRASMAALGLGASSGVVGGLLLVVSEICA